MHSIGNIKMAFLDFNWSLEWSYGHAQALRKGLDKLILIKSMQIPSLAISKGEPYRFTGIINICLSMAHSNIFLWVVHFSTSLCLYKIF